MGAVKELSSHDRKHGIGCSLTPNGWVLPTLKTFHKQQRIIMLKVGNLVINLGAIAYVDLEAKKSYIIDREETQGVRIYLKASDEQGNLATLFFKGEEAEYLRKYFLSVASLCGGVEDV
jgi:hypothetical protein